MFIQYAASPGEYVPDYSGMERNKTCRYSFNDIIGHSPVMDYTINMAKIFAETNSSILITGETGTGKELLAQSIHAYSNRRNKIFLAINCASISESLFESELFGYDRGAFTGANREGKAGVFELADGGTLFLDEIGEIPFPLQIKLLRVLQEKQIRRIGGRNDIPVNIRIIAAANQDIERLIADGQFRTDLYYRLNVLRLNLPSLRDRLEDIPELVYAITRKYHLESDAQFIVREILYRYKGYNWPGNVRELENIVQRLTVMKKCTTLDRGKEASLSAESAYGSLVEKQSGALVREKQEPPPLALKDYHSFKKRQDLEYLNQVIQYFGGNKIKAAAFLHISRTTLWSRLKEAKETVSR
jgi:transcriptional regulator with PAS, ATPase and Fis domain